MKTDEPSSNQGQNQRKPFSGIIEQIGGEMKKLKEIDVDEVVLSYNFVPTGRDMEKMVDTSKVLAGFVS